MLWAPWAASSRKISLRRSTGISRPKSPWLMLSFWQNTHPREQPEKNTVPAPRVPERGGSSQWWRAARATTGRSGIRQRPLAWVRSPPHRRGQRVQWVGS